MQKIKGRKRHYTTIANRRKFKQSLIRKRKKQKEKAGEFKFKDDVRKMALKNGITKQKQKFRNFKRIKHIEKPEYSDTIKFIAEKKEAFSKISKPRNEDGYFLIPEIFSLHDNYNESYEMLKRLFYVLYNQSASNITFDYANCKRIDIDASVVMDILLGEFILYFKKCTSINYTVKVLSIKPINWEKAEIKKMLFSIGAFSSITGFRINYEDVIPYPLKFSIIKSKNASRVREIHITEMVDYVIRCMEKMNRSLSPEAEKNLFEVIGEALINAEEHSSGDKRFAIGYFQDSEDDGEHIGIFNLAILNFGNTIYEMFKNPDCPNYKAVNAMTSLSSKFTQRGIFRKAEFEEQTLWTLYALQEGITSKADWRRGNGSIRFIESFFNLKGDNEKDNVSFLSIVSGNTRIIFDGSYRLIERPRGKHQKLFKMMTFNEIGDLETKPDKKFVTFVDNYFPGTLITAKICIKE